MIQRLDFNKLASIKPEERTILAGVGGLLGNNGRPPKGNNGQHDCGGDLQGQADILHKVNILHIGRYSL